MLGAEEKRWLVIGICLSKVLTPVLRKVIKEELQKEYQRLITPPNKLHSQTFAYHLKVLPPSTLRLNYVNINDNETKGAPKDYDYSVRDDVSLAKLFVKPFMAGFEAFDETLDSSAALSILCGAPNFVFNGVDDAAMYVRSEVRNEWGHCKFAMWTAAYYSQCFKRMEELIKSFNLPVTSVKQDLEDLNEWKNRGISMCFEQPINSEVLKLVQEGMVTLVQSVEENKGTWVQDHEGLKNNLQNLTQLFGMEIKNLEAKHSDLRSGFQRLESRTEDLETKVSGLSQGIDTGNELFKSGYLWKVPVAVIFVFLLILLLYESYSQDLLLAYWYSQQGPLSKMVPVVSLFVCLLIFLYEHYTKGSMLRYWYCRRGSLKGGRTVSFVFTTHDHQVPTVNGLEFSWDNLKKKMSLAFEPMDLPGVHYFLNTDRYAYGGVVPVRSLLDGTPQVRGAEVFAINAECTMVFFEEGGSWKPYRSARNIRCVPQK